MLKAAERATVGFGGDGAPRAKQDIVRRRLGRKDRKASVCACDLARKRREKVKIACFSRRIEAQRVSLWKFNRGVERARRAVSGASSARDLVNVGCALPPTMPLRERKLSVRGQSD